MRQGDKCKVCGHPVHTQTAELVAEHETAHAVWLAGVQAISYSPSHYHEREAKKRWGQRMMHLGRTFEEKVRGAEVWLGAYFDRSLQWAIESDLASAHPSFSDFIAMMDLPGDVFPREIIAELRLRHGAARLVQIELGDAWSP